MSSARSPMVAGASAAAFFDLDNTLLHGASLFLIGRGMHARGVVSTTDVLRGGWQQLVFRLVGERHADVSAVRDRGLALGAGVEVAPLVAIGEEIFDELIADRILAETLALAQAHLACGEDVYIVTAAPVELARIVAQRLGLTGALGTVSEVEDGRWTGRLVGELLHGPAKAEAVTRLATDRGYDLSRCAAYSDSINDLPLLTAVGAPHAVNPDRRLRAHADIHAWPIHDFRTARRRVLLVSALVGATVGASVVGIVAARRRADPRCGLAEPFARGTALGNTWEPPLAAVPADASKQRPSACRYRLARAFAFRHARTIGTTVYSASASCRSAHLVRLRFSARPGLSDGNGPGERSGYLSTRGERITVIRHVVGRRKPSGQFGHSTRTLLLPMQSRTTTPARSVCGRACSTTVTRGGLRCDRPGRR